MDVSEQGGVPRARMGGTQRLTPLELFFDLVFVFALTQVTGFLTHHLRWLGMLQGGALLTALWAPWAVYSWLPNAVPAEEVIPARLLSFYNSFGEYDVVVIYEAPDQSTAAAIEVAARAPGHLSAVKTTVLLSAEEGLGRCARRVRQHIERRGNCSVVVSLLLRKAGYRVSRPFLLPWHGMSAFRAPDDIEAGRGGWTSADKKPPKAVEEPKDLREDGEATPVVVSYTTPKLGIVQHPVRRTIADFERLGPYHKGRPLLEGVDDDLVKAARLKKKTLKEAA